MGYNAMSEDEIRSAALGAARESFLAAGIGGTRMNRIAARIGVSRSTLYLYFPSKVDLVFHIARELMAEISRGAQGRADGPDGLSAVRAYLAHVLAHFRAHIEIARFFDEFDTIYSGDYPNVEEARLYSEAMAEHMRGFNALVARGQADGSVRADVPANILGSVLADGLYGIIERLLPRKAHIEREHEVAIDAVIDLYVSFMESFVKRTCIKS